MFIIDLVESSGSVNGAATVCYRQVNQDVNHMIDEVYALHITYKDNKSALGIRHGFNTNERRLK